MPGINKRPDFYSEEERDFFEKTPKHALFKLLRDFAVQAVGEDGYIDTWVDNPGAWVKEAKSRKDVAI